MKKIYLLALTTLITATVFSQSIYRISFTEKGSMDAISIDLGDNIIMNLKDDGSLINWGFDVYKSRGGENYTGQLETYVGRIEYFSEAADIAIRGKIKYVGSVAFNYYASYEGDEFKGKLKSIGNNNFQYYARYDDAAFQGKIKSIGMTTFNWFAAYENEAMRGKLKSVGNTAFSYYSSMEDKAFRGRVKSIDGSSFTYYSSFDTQEYRGRMKTGTQLQYINGIKYFVRN